MKAGGHHSGYPREPACFAAQEQERFGHHPAHSDFLGAGVADVLPADSERRGLCCHVTAEPHEDNAYCGSQSDILDANGEPLVTSRPAFCVYYWYTDKTQAEAVLPRLAAILGTDMADVEKRVLQYQGRYFEPIPIAKDITPEQYTAIVEDAPNLTGVFIEAEPIRFYPNNEVMSPILGYVGEISEWRCRMLGIRTTT